MAKFFDSSSLVNKLPQDDPECIYVNKMMEISSEILRDMHRSGEMYESMHGVVPSYRLPEGYSFGNLKNIYKNKSSDENLDNKNNINIHSQNSSNSNSTLRMESDEHDNETIQVDENMKMIETVRGDLTLSEDEDDHETKNTSNKTNSLINSQDNGRLLFDTLNACSKKLPSLNSLNVFQKHYKSSKSAKKTCNNTKKILSDNVSVETESFEDTNDTPAQCQQKIMKLMNLLSKNTYQKNLITSFQPIYNLINDKKRKPEKLNSDEKSVTPPKLLKLSNIQEKKKENIANSKYRIYSKKNVYELSMDVIPDMTKDIHLDKFKELYKSMNVPPKESIVTDSYVKPKYTTQDSLPFTRSDSTIKKDSKISEDNLSNTTAQLLINNVSSENNQNIVKKPEAAAKQFYPPPTDYSKSKVAVVTGNINKILPNSHIKIEINDKTTVLPSNNSQTSSYQRPHHTQHPRHLAYKDSTDNGTDESKVVQGLVAMNKMKAYFKNDFIARMRNLDMNKWLKEVSSLREKATKCKKQLDFAPQIMVYIRKNLFYNYSLEVKGNYDQSHHTYLENASKIKQYCSDITNIYNEHEKEIIDASSTRLWNIKLVKHFTTIMCHRLSAILQYRAFRNVSEDCKKLHSTLFQLGVIDRNDRTSAITESHQHGSPFSVLSSYSPGQVSTRNSSPRQCNSGNHNTTLLNNFNNNLSNPEIKSKLQRYIDQTSIINTAYNDWLMAEHLHARYCRRSTRHEDAWRDFEWKIIEKTGGFAISSIDESVPFVIKYLEGYINFMNEFMKHSL